MVMFRFSTPESESAERPASCATWRVMPNAITALVVPSSSWRYRPAALPVASSATPKHFSLSRVLRRIQNEGSRRLRSKKPGCVPPKGLHHTAHAQAYFLNPLRGLGSSTGSRLANSIQASAYLVYGLIGVAVGNCDFQPQYLCCAHGYPLPISLLPPSR